MFVKNVEIKFREEHLFVRGEDYARIVFITKRKNLKLRGEKHGKRIKMRNLWKEFFRTWS